MKRFCLSIWILSVLTLLLLPQLSYASTSPMALLKKTQKKVEKLFKHKISNSDKKAKQQRELKIRALVQDFFDFDMLAKGSLGEHWKSISSAEQNAFTFWFKEMLKQAYLRGVKSASKKKKGKKYRLKYKKEKIVGKKASVSAQIRYQIIRRNRKRWRRINLEWLFVMRKGRWMVRDLITNDNSLMDTYKEQFDKIIRKKSFRILLKKIRKKVRALRKKNGLIRLIGPSLSPAK